MADGEINVAVQAEGVDEAAGELGGDGAGGGEAPELGGPDGDGGGGRSGTFGKLLTRIATLLVFLGPILDVLGAVSGVLKAFVAPLAVLLMRLLAPVLRIMIKVLPVWFAIADILNSALSVFLKLRSELLARMLEFLGIRNPVENIVGLLGMVESGIDNLPTTIDGLKAEVRSRLQSLITDVRNLPENIAAGISDQLPDFGLGGGGSGGGIGSGFIDTLRELADADGGGSGGNTLVSLEGGLSTFVENANRDENVDLT